MGNSPPRAIFFERVKEPREGYFAEYSPPGGEIRFAWLTLVFYAGVSPAHAKKAMEEEAVVWTRRYPVPVMVFASDEKGDTVEITQEQGKNNLIAWKHPDGSMEMHWELLKDEHIPDVALSVDYLLKVYEGLPYRTAEEGA